MTGRARPTATALRSRLSAVLALGVVVPVLLAAGVAGLWLPRHERSLAQHAAGRDARSAHVALRASCKVVGEAATATARQVQQYATDYGSIPAAAAEAAARTAVAANPGVAVAVFDADWRPLAIDGATAGRAPAAAGGYGASCSHALPGSNLRVAGLAERRRVATAGDGLVGHVVLWLPVDDGALATLRAGLGTDGHLGVLGSGRRLLAASSAADRDGLRAAVRAADAVAEALEEDAAAGRDPYAEGGDPNAGGLDGDEDVGTPGRAGDAGLPAGVAAGLGYAVLPAGPGVPFRVVATAAVGGAGAGAGRPGWLPGLPGWLPSPGPVGLVPVALLVALLGVVALLPVRVLAARLSRPVDEELRAVTGELQDGRTALARSFTSFGEALEHTHDLERLLDTVSAFCLHGTGAIAGVALLTDETPGQPEPDPRSPPALRARGAARTAGDEAAAALDRLPAFAERYFRELTSAGTGTGIGTGTGTGLATGPAAAGPLFGRIDGAGPVVAVPIRSGDRLTGMLALARGEGTDAFDALALPRVRAVADHVGTAVANVRLHEEVRRLSVTDPLTGVGNVRQLTTTLSREVAGAIRYDRPLTVLMLDLDHFKRVNDTLGHPFGDVVLREFAHRVSSCLREMDTVARYGGEEFAVVLRDTDVDGGCRVAERVLALVREQPFRHGDLWQSVTVSIGVAAFGRHGRTAGEVLQAADEALYTAKRDGRDRFRVAGSGPAASAISQAG